MRRLTETKLYIPEKNQQTCVRAWKCVSPMVSLQRSPSKGLSPKVSLNLISMSFYAHSHLQQSKPLRFSLLQALERDPISLGNSLPIYSPPHFPCKLKLFIFQLASPPSIHMDSWWAACNLIQGPKWTHNTAYGRA